MEEVELTIEKIVAEGQSLARHGGFVVFVKGALPGEKVRVEIVRRKSQFAFGELKEILEPSKERREPECTVYPVCGGCSFLHLSYPAQLKAKIEILKEALHSLPQAQDKINEVIGMSEPYYFRNKMEYTFGHEDSYAVLGLHRRGDYKKIVSTSDCLLQSKSANEVVQDTLHFVRRENIAGFNKVTKEGILRHLMIREGKHTGERLVHLFSRQLLPVFENLVGVYGDKVTTFLVSLNCRAADAAQSERSWLLNGEGVIHERVNDFLFQIETSTFFQTNTLQAERMFQMLLDWGREVEPKLVIDLYAGIGPIGFHLSKVAEKVISLESNPDSVRLAEINRIANNIYNLQIVCAQVEKALPASFPERVDLMVIDPPRAGIHKKALKKVLALSPAFLFYVSCNPSTLARDLEKFITAGYAIERVQPVDMFPHTFHLETLVFLKKKLLSLSG